MPPFDNKDYVTVAERVRIAHEKGLIKSITTHAPVMLNDVLGFIKVEVVFTNDTRAMGIGSFRLDAKKGAQLTNPLEDAETSAIGRALAFLGIAVSRSIASADEIKIAKERELDLDVSTMQRMITRLKMLINQAASDGLKIDHRLASLKPNEMSYDEIVEYGMYLKDLLNIE